MAKIVAFSGISDSGKTTLIQKLINFIQGKYQVLAVKHDSKNKAVFDNPLKDSAKFFQAGADVCITSEIKSAVFRHQEISLKEICLEFKDKDFIFIEGFKQIECSRICVIRDKIYQEEFKNAQALAVSNIKLIENLNFSGALLQLDDIRSIFQWIDKNAKTLEELEWKK